MSKEKSCYFELLQSKKNSVIINLNNRNNITIKKKYIYKQIKINIKISNTFIVRGANLEIINP